MTRDLAALTARRFDVVVIGGGIHGLAIAYDAAQRGLSAALLECGDFGGGSSFNHAKTVHGGLRSLQTGDIAKARFSMRERRAFARIAPNFIEPRQFMMATTRQLTRRSSVLRAGFALDALVGHDRHVGVPPRLRLPAGRVVARTAYESAFGADASASATGGASWFDYHMPESDRLTLAVGLAATAAGAVLANYVRGVRPRTEHGRIAGVDAEDIETGAPITIAAAAVVNAAGAASREWMRALGGRPTFPLIKATNVVTTRPAPPMALGAPTSGGRLLLSMPWKGRALLGTSHSDVEVAPEDSSVGAGELDAFLDEINSAFPTLALTTADISLVHRGVVPAQRYRNGALGLMGHHIIHDHARDGVPGGVSVIGVKYTTGRGVAEDVVDRLLRTLGRPAVPCRTGHMLLPGAFVHDEADEAVSAISEAGSRLPDHVLRELVRTHGRAWRSVVALVREDRSLADPVDPAGLVPAAAVAYAVRHEMARTLSDVVLRRTNLGAAGFPGHEVAARCATVMAAERGWDRDRIDQEVGALARFYLPVGPVAGR